MSYPRLPTVEDAPENSSWAMSPPSPIRWPPAPTPPTKPEHEKLEPGASTETLPTQPPKKNKDRTYTPKEDRAIERIRQCQTKDYYKLLNVEDTATASKITAKYRKLALLTHPDKNNYPDAEDCFKCESWSVH